MNEAGQSDLAQRSFKHSCPDRTPTSNRSMRCRLGDRVGVTLPAGSPASFGAGGAWFEGVCEKVDLRWALDCRV